MLAKELTLYLSCEEGDFKETYLCCEGAHPFRGTLSRQGLNQSS